MFLPSVGLGLGGRRGGSPPDVTPPTITSSSSASVQENVVLAHALTADEGVTWAIRTAVQDAASVDHAQFEISGSTLRWASNGTQDYEAPADDDTDNAYVVVVRATDLGANTTDQTITVTVTDHPEGLIQFVGSAGVAVSLSGTNQYVGPAGTAVNEDI